MQSKKSRSRTRGQRGGFGFFKKLLTMLLIVVLVLFGLTLFFKVENIDVTGSAHDTPEAVIAASGIQYGDNLMLVNRSETASQIVAALPYVKSVRVRKQLPSTILLELIQAEPAAVVVSEYGDFWLVSDEGKLLEQITANQAEAYLQIYGFQILLPAPGEMPELDEASQEKLTVALDLIAALRDVPLSVPVTRMDLEYLYDITLTCGDRFEVRLGSAQDLDYKLRYLQAAMEQLTNGQSGIIDLTFSEEKIARFLPW